jgi:hypothetical protein
MKQKYINSISLLAVCAVLSGCGNSDKQKSISELKADLIAGRRLIGVLSGDTLREAKQSGVPLPEGVAPKLQGDIATQAETTIATTPQKLQSDLANATDELGILMDSGAYVRNQAYWKLIQAKAEELRTRKELLIAQMQADRLAAAARKKAQEAASEETDYPSVSNTSFSSNPEDDFISSSTSLSDFDDSAAIDSSLPGSPASSGDDWWSPSVSTLNILSRSSSMISMADDSDEILMRPDQPVPASTITDFFAPLPTSDAGDESGAAALVRSRNILRGAHDSALVVPGQGTFGVRTNADDLANDHATTFAAFTGILPVIPSGSVGVDAGALAPSGVTANQEPFQSQVQIDAEEAVYLRVKAFLSHTHITGGILDAAASPAIVDAVRNASVLAMLNGTPEFGTLNPAQQQLAAELALAQYITGGVDSVFQGRFRAMLRGVGLIGTLQEGGNRTALTARLAADGFANADMVAEALRVYDMLNRFYTATTTTTTRFQLFVRVLMAGNNRTLTDREYSDALVEIAENSGRSIADTAVRYEVPIPMAEVIVGDMTRTIASGVNLNAIQQASRQALMDGSTADPSQTALVASVANRRLATSGTATPTDTAGAIAVRLSDALQVLPAGAGLDLLADLHRREVERLSSELNDVRLAIGDDIPTVVPGSAAAAADASASEPAFSLPEASNVEATNFTRKYHTFTGAFSKGSLGVLQHTVALKTLQTSIKGITVPEATQFKEFPLALKQSYLRDMCSLPDAYVPLLWSATRNDTTFMPRLVAYIVDERKVEGKRMVDILGYNQPTGGAVGLAERKVAWSEVSKFSDATISVTPFILSGLKTTAPEDYKAVLGKIGEAVETYLDTVRTNILDLIAKEKAEAARGMDLDKAYATLQKNRAALAHELGVQVEAALKKFIEVPADRATKIDAGKMQEFVRENQENFKTGNIETLVRGLYAIVVNASTLGRVNPTLFGYIKDTIRPKETRDAIIEAINAAIRQVLSTNTYTKAFFSQSAAAPSQVEELMAKMLSKGTIESLSDNVSLRQARTATTGLVDGRAFNMNGVTGQSVELGLPLFVQLKGDVSSAKSTEAATGSVAYRLGNTVIGAIQGYANSGAGFGTDSRQLETSVVASHSFGSFFVEGQIGTVSANDVHISDWSGDRSQVTLGLDTEFVSPFVQLTHRQLDRSGLDLSETTGYVGLDIDIAKLAADTYSVDTRLLAKAGYGSKAWSAGSKDLGSTTGFSGSVEWSASLNLNSGVTFSSNLALDTLAGSSAAVNVSLDR